MAHIKTSVLIIVALASVHKSVNVTATQTVDVRVLYPETVNDTFGNTADRNSSITFVNNPVNESYKSDGKTPSDIGAIGPFYDMAKSIVGSSLPGAFPFDWVKKVKDGNIQIESDWKKIASDYLGYIIAVVVGLLFFLLFPIVGMCFCCCCCCGRCGAKRIIKNAADAGQGDKLGRVTAMGILSAFTTLALVGSILMFVTNSNLSSSMKDFHNNDVDKLDDLQEFFNATVQQAENLISANFNFTLKVLFRDLDNIGYLLGMPIRENILISTGLGQTYDNIEALESDAKTLLLNLQSLQTNKSIAVEKSELFHNFTIAMNETVENLAVKYPDFATEIPDRKFVTDFNASQLPDEDEKVMALDMILRQGVHSLTDESKQNLNDIPERVQNDTLQKRNDLKNDVNTYTKDVSKMITDLNSMKNDVLNGINFDDLKDDAKDYTDKAVKYDQYRWYGGLGIACVTMIIGLLLALGIMFGLFGGSFTDDPAMRGKLSNAGGHMLFVGVILTFIFGWLTMLVTTLVFAVGAPAEKFVCGPAQDLSVFDKLVDEYGLFEGSSNGSWLGKKVYSGKNVVLKLSELMESCKKGRTVYLALKMEEANVFNLSDVADYQKKFSIEDKLGSTVVNFDNITITTGPLMKFIDIMKTFDSRMDYKTYNSTLSKAPVEPSKTFLQKLNMFIKNYTFPNSSVEEEFQNVSKAFTSNIKDTGNALETSINKIQEALENIKRITQLPQHNNLTERCNKLEKSLYDIEQNLPIDAAKSFNNSLTSFEDRLTNNMDVFIAKMDNAVKNEIGICLPLWNLYSDLMVYGICRAVIGSLNGWWCAVGWTTFFLTMSIIAAIKLSKHFRRMKYSSDESDNHFTETTHHFQNKVFHSDIPVESKNH